MSRGGARRHQLPHVGRSGRRSLGVWAIYIVGGVAAAILFLSALFAAGAYSGSQDVAVRVELEVSPLALCLWGGLAVLAVATWLWRRRRVHT